MTLAHWNPKTALRTGLEIGVDMATLDEPRWQLFSSGSARRGRFQTWRSESADTVDTIQTKIAVDTATLVVPGASTAEDVTGIWAVEVFEEGDEYEAWSAWTAVDPNGEAFSEGEEWIGGGAGNFNDLADTSDQTGVRFTGTAVSTNSGLYGVYAGFNFNTAAISATGKRVELRARLRLKSSSVNGSRLRFGLTFDNLTNLYEFAEYQSFEIGSSVTEIVVDFPEFNPSTKRPWNESDLQDFDLGTDFVIRQENSASGEFQSQEYRIYKLELEYRTADESRVAWGLKEETATTLFQGTTLFLETTVDLTQPDSASDWSKAANTTYTTGFRVPWLGQGQFIKINYDKVSGGGTKAAWAEFYAGLGGQFEITYLTGPQAPNVTGYAIGTYYIAPFGSGSSQKTGAVAFEPSGSNNLYSWVPFIFSGGGTDTGDCPAYATVYQSPVSSGVELRQEFSAAASATYGRVAVLVRFGATPTADLTIDIERTSDQVSFGTGTITAAEVAALPAYGEREDWRIAYVDLTSTSALVSGTDYDIVLSSTTDSSAPWYGQVLDTRSPLATAFNSAGVGQESTFSGAEGVTISSTIREEADLVAYVFQAPDSVSGPTGASNKALFTDLRAPYLPALEGIGDLCLPETFPRVDLDWTAVSYTDFQYYEVQRGDPFQSPDFNVGTTVATDVTWTTIAYLTSQSIDGFVDYEARTRGVSYYRVRGWDNDQGPSPWTYINSTGIVGGATYEGLPSALWLSSNADPTQLFGLVDVYPRAVVPRYTLPEQGAAVALPIHNRDTPIMLRPAERSGVVFERDVIVDISPRRWDDNFTLVSTTVERPPGPHFFEALRRLVTDSSLPYVCVRDDIGNRFFGSVQIVDMLPEVMTDDVVIHRARIRVTETSLAPVAVTAAV